MAVSLTSSLLAHQARTRRLPAVRVTSSATRGGVPILRWEQRYAGSEPADHAAATLTPAGTLLRGRDNAGSLEIARTPNPAGEAAVFDGWTSIATITTDTPIAIASRDGEVLLAACSDAGKTIDMRTSSDDGVTWSAAVSVVIETAAIGALALAFNPAGDACLFYVVGTSSALKRLRRSSGTWSSSGTTWTKSASVSSLTGFAACHDGADFVLAATGTEATTLNPRTWSVRFGDGGLPANAWSGLTAIAEADAGSTISFDSPSILAMSGDFHAFVNRRQAADVASISTVATHPLHLAGSASTWTEPFPQGDTDGGIALAGSDSSAVWAASPGAVYRASLDSQHDLSAHVLAIRWALTHDSATCQLELDADANAAALAPGDTITLRHGYASGAGGAAEYGLELDFTIQDITCSDDNGGGRITITTDGPWEQLARWHAPETWQAADSDYTRDALFARLAARAGVMAASAGSPIAPPGEWTDTGIAFALTPGETARTALGRLLLGIDAIAIPGGGGLVVRGLPTNEAASFDIGGDGQHPIADLESVTTGLPGWVRLQGDGISADAFGPGSAPHMQLIRDTSATTDELAANHAAAILRRSRAETPQLRLVIPFHAGIELGDVLAITSAMYQLDAKLMRVIGLGVRFQRGPRGQRYDTLLTMGEV